MLDFCLVKTINQIQRDYEFQFVELVKFDVIGISLNSTIFIGVKKMKDTKLINANKVSIT